MRTLNLGCFPKKVLEFEDSQEFLEQIIFLDYQLQLFIHNKLNGEGLVPPERADNIGYQTELLQMITFLSSVGANYHDSSKTYEEKLYFNVVLSQLHFLNLDFDSVRHQLLQLEVKVNPNWDYTPNTVINEFLASLTCRYYTLLGLTKDSYKTWVEYLKQVKRPFSKSQASAQYWTDCLYDKLAVVLSSGKTVQLSFKKDVVIISNDISIMGFSNYLLSSDYASLVDSKFHDEYNTYLESELSDFRHSHIGFPSAKENSNELEYMVGGMFLSFFNVSSRNRLLKAQNAKNFLISCSEKTYQSQVVLSAMIRVLIELKEYDEAFAAFKTWVAYEETIEEQHDGNIHDILQVIDLYGLCIEKFNPYKSRNRSKLFKYTSLETLITALDKYSAQLLSYLNKLEVICGLTYDSSDSELAKDPLSFLTTKYNLNILLPDNSEYVKIVSRAWYAMGSYNYFLVSYKCPSFEKLKNYTEIVATYLKNALIVNSTGRCTYLFQYALILAYKNELKPAMKLCKFILKQYPESFKTWNLFVLILSALDVNDKSGTIPSLGNQKPTTNGNGNGQISTETLRDLETFIKSALNIAAIYLSKNNEVPVEVRYDILQLKLTQMALWESIYGVQYVLDNLPDVFQLYYELFNVPQEIVRDSNLKMDSTINSTWSHRPSFIGPMEKKSLKQDNNKEKQSIKRLSRMGTMKSTRSEGNSELRSRSSVSIIERKILQELWLWTMKIYAKIGLTEEAEQCIVEAETVWEPNVKTFSSVAMLTSKTRKFLSLQECERCLEFLDREDINFHIREYGNSILCLAKLFVVDDNLENLIFISTKDLNAGVIRIKNYLERFLLSWPFGFNNSEIWYYLSKIYEMLDDRTLLSYSLWRAIDLEDSRPVRSFEVVDELPF